MAGYQIIAEVGETIVKILRENMVPEIIANTESIGLCHPSDKGDFVLGVNLYDVKESEEIISTKMSPIGTDRQRFPSSFYSLYYMITAYSPSDIKFRSAEEQKILGRALQVLKDNSLIDAGRPGGSSAKSEYPTKIELQQMTNDEKMKLWNVPNMPYKLSLFYKVYPVEIESTRIRDITRVSEVSLDIREAQAEKR